MRTVTLYTARGCHLCDEARAVLDRVQREIPFLLERISIDGDARLESLHRGEIPVVYVDGHKRFKFRVDPARLRRLLTAVHG